MDRKRKVAVIDRRKVLDGWERAAVSYVKPLVEIRKKAIENGTATQRSMLKPNPPHIAGELAENDRKRMLARVGQRLNYKKSDLRGAQFGYLLVWERLPNEANGDVPRYLCLCTCGQTCEVAANLLVQRVKHHCGCRAAKKRRMRRWRLRRRLKAAGRQRRSARKFRVGMRI
jgi:hypothetical protein